MTCALGGVILAGGRSRRMGEDKAVLVVEGRRMIDRVVDAVVDAGCDPVRVVGGDAEALAPLAVPFVADAHPGEGPLGGLVSAFAALPEADALLMVPCDVPLIAGDRISPLVDRWRLGPAADVIVATTDRVEPMCAIWTRRSSLRAADAFAAGARSLHHVLGLVDVVEVPIDAASLFNVNAPQDLHAARRVGSSPVTIPEITVDELAALGPDVRLIDVREDDEWADAHVPHAVHVPLGTVPESLDRFDGAPTYVMCKVGGRSLRACEFAAARGHDVVNVTGGILAWVAAELATESGGAGA